MMPNKYQISSNIFSVISDTDFNKLREIIYKNLGIHLTEQKRSMVVGRLQRLLGIHGLNSFTDYVSYLNQDISGRAINELANRISTNHTFFYREHAHFDFFRKKVISKMIKRHARDKDLRIWCAGCSSGDEAYTLIIEMMEFLGNDYVNWQAGVLATDLSSKVLSTAIRGIYPKDRLKKVPENILKRYFKKQDDGQWQVRNFVRQEVTFRCLNLIHKKFPCKKPFDLILCRNVMIYFDKPTRDSLVQRYYNHTIPGGYLFIGHSETINQDKTPYKYVQPAIYKKDILKEC